MALTPLVIKKMETKNPNDNNPACLLLIISNKTASTASKQIT